MAIIPKIPKKSSLFKTCPKCGQLGDDFAKTHSIFYPEGTLPICNGCIGEYLKEHDFDWEYVDKVCQWSDIPFIVKEWERLAEINGVENTWPIYANVFAADEYKSIGWGDYFKQYQKLRETGLIESEIPLVYDHKLEEMRKTWGENYSEEELYYLEDLYKGLLVSQSVNGALPIDQARKICKLSLEIDSKIRAGDKDVDKLLSSYDRLVKIAEFTPKNTKNAVDFDSFAEVGYWLEKKGHINKFYDNVTRDVIDETLKNIENYNQRLYINEGGIGEEITQRLKALENANELEANLFDIAQEYDLDEYDNEGYLVGEEDDFEAEVDNE